MGEYKVVLKRQKLVGGKHRPQNWGDSWEEFHLLEASNNKEAIAKAQALADWVNNELPGGEVVTLSAIYKLPLDRDSSVMPIAVQF